MTWKNLVEKSRSLLVHDHGRGIGVRFVLPVSDTKTRRDREAAKLQTSEDDRRREEAKTHKWIRVSRLRLAAASGSAWEGIASGQCVVGIRWAFGAAGRGVAGNRG